MMSLDTCNSIRELPEVYTKVVAIYSAPKNCSSVLDFLVGLHVSSEPWHLLACV